MSYIVPREKPKQCNDCPFMYNDTLDCRLNKESYLYTCLDKQYTNCPLVEVPTPHGRLIDADAFEDAFNMELLPILINKYGEEEALKGLHFSFRDCICNIQAQKTVIEAEGSEE